MGMRPIDYKNKIILNLAETTCNKILKKVIRSLQKMTDDLLLGDDSELKNIWDEICVQVRCQHSIYWGAYLDTARFEILGELKKLASVSKEAIWLQTDEGTSWAECEEDYNPEGNSTPYVDDDDIIEYILEHFILSMADMRSDALEELQSSIGENLENYRTGKQKRYYPKKCFEKAFQYMIDVRPKDGVLLHGKYSPFKVPEDWFSYMEHAWVELPGDIIFDGVLQRFYRKVDYYNYYHAVKVYEYTCDEAVKKVSVEHTSGPWEYDILMKFSFLRFN